ncbi:MAG TPA: 2-oxoacid:acceptor oxidoreductase family protein [Acidimicrobiia bacterium]|jgi:2-oxoglutarate ferredoxin oxidoreductase subunit gamma
MTQREVLFTGVGGQGVQIVSKALAMAAVADGREVMLLPTYSGGMRGGMTNAGLTVGDAPLRAVPVITSAWSAFAMDPAFWDTVSPNLAEGAIVVVNSTLFALDVDVPGARVYGVAAMDIAAEIESPMSAGFVLLGAFAALTGLVAVESVVAAMRELVPAYRTQHVAANERAIGAGAASVPALAEPAWSPVAGAHR